MQKANKQYIPFQPVKMANREWPDKVITKAPVWCSVDLRDGNQALVTPMQLDEKLLMFKTLVDIGFRSGLPVCFRNGIRNPAYFD